MELLYKAKAFLKKEGIIKTIFKIYNNIKKCMRKIPNILYEKCLYKIRIEHLKELADKKNVYILIPCIDWETPIFQRPHQIACELGKQNENLVLFISDQYIYDNFAVSERVRKNVFLFSGRMCKKLDYILENAKKRIVFMSWTMHANYLSLFHYDKLVYEYIDELSLFYFYNSKMEQTHCKLLTTADIVVCTAQELYEKAKCFSEKAILCENAGDYDFFKNSRNVPVNSNIKDIVNNYACVLGYYGCLANWFDYKLIINVAQKRKDWLFVLIGYEFDNSANEIKCRKLNNVLVLPPQPYQQLPGFIAGFDVLIIPFILNDITKSTSPVKLFEYMAAGKPILTSDMLECRKYQSVYRYTSTEDFISKTEELLAIENNAPYYAIMEREALENTWSARVNSILMSLD